MVEPIRKGLEQVDFKLGQLDQSRAQSQGALEAMAAPRAGAFLFGDAPTLADGCLVPQLYNARRFGVDVSAFHW